MAAPKLRNALWNVSLKRISPYLDDFQARLNDVSDDIRALEKYLTETGFRVPVETRWNGGDGIAWTDHASTWRLCYVSEDNDGHIYLRPLIETPAADRLRAAEAMPDFLEFLAGAAGVPRARDESEPVEPVTNDDIPF